MSREETSPSSDEPWALDRLRLPPEMIGDLSAASRPPRHRPGETFIKGPIPYAWMASACRLPGSGFHVAMVCRFFCARFQSPVRLGMETLAEELGVCERTARRGFHDAERARLFDVERRTGCKLAVSISDLPRSKPNQGNRPLYGPIPWSWWHPASRLPGRSLQVGAACWLAAGWERSAEFELVLSGWANLGIDRFSASSGLAALERADLVAVLRRPGRAPVVTILDASASSKTRDAPRADSPEGRGAERSVG